MIKLIYFLPILFFSNKIYANISNTIAMADGLSSCAGTYMFAQEIYKNANNDERVKMFQDLSSQYLSAAEASYFFLKMSLFHRERLPKITCKKHSICGTQDLSNS